VHISCPALPHPLQRRTHRLVAPACRLSSRLSSTTCSATSLSAIITSASSCDRVPPFWIRFFSTFTCRSSVVGCLKVGDPTSQKRLGMHHHLSSLLELLHHLNNRRRRGVISCALLGVFGCQKEVPGSGGDGVRGLTSSFNSTASGLSGTKPAVLKPVLMLLDENTLSCTLVGWLVGWY
jgi:hypothetical protein